MKSAQQLPIQDSNKPSIINKQSIIIFIQDIDETVKKCAGVIEERRKKKFFGNLFFESKTFEKLKQFLKNLQGHSELKNESKLSAPISHDAKSPLNNKQLFELAIILLDQSLKSNDDDKIIYPCLIQLLNKFSFVRLSALARLHLYQELTIDTFKAICEIIPFYAETVARIISLNTLDHPSLYNGDKALSDKKSLEITRNIISNYPFNLASLLGHDDTTQKNIMNLFDAKLKYFAFIRQWAINNVTEFMAYVLSINSKDLKHVFEIMFYLYNMNILKNDCRDFIAKHPEYAFAVSRAITWLENHKINTPENRAQLFSSAPLAGYFFNVDNSPAKEQDINFNQAIFQLTLTKAKEKQQSISLFFKSSVKTNNPEDECSKAANIVMGYLH